MRRRARLIAEKDRAYVSSARLSILLGSDVFALSIPFVLTRYQIAVALWLCSVPAGFALRRLKVGRGKRDITRRVGVRLARRLVCSDAESGAVNTGKTGRTGHGTGRTYRGDRRAAR